MSGAHGDMLHCLVRKQALERAIELAKHANIMSCLAECPKSYEKAIRDVVKSIEAEVRFPFPNNLSS